MNIFLTFGDSRLTSAAARIKKQARKMGTYDETLVLNETDLDVAFRQRFSGHLVVGTRGFGWWCWKPQIILQVLSQCGANDLVHYSDIGCHLNPRGKKRLWQYFETVASSSLGVLAFSYEPPDPALNIPDQQYIDHSIKRWTKSDLLEYFGVIDSPEICDSPMVSAGNMFIKNNCDTVSFVKSWLRPIYEDFRLIDDTASRVPNHPSFVEHRHDMSIYSVLCRLNPGIAYLSAFEQDFRREGKFDTAALARFPIHAVRDKSANSGLLTGVIKRGFRKVWGRNEQRAYSV